MQKNPKNIINKGTQWLEAMHESYAEKLQYHYCLFQIDFKVTEMQLQPASVNSLHF